MSFQGEFRSRVMSISAKTICLGMMLALSFGAVRAQFIQQGNKLVGTGAAHDSSSVSQGSAVSISADGNTALIGGYIDNNETGAAWIFTRAISGIGEPGGGLPAQFALAQNYPNPFNPATTITFALSVPSLVRLSVFDILGREVSVLVDGRREAGIHEVRFDGSGLASGVYFYRIQAGDFVSTKRLMLLR